MTKFLELKVPANFDQKLHSELQHNNPEKNAGILQLGNIAYETIQTDSGKDELRIVSRINQSETRLTEKICNNILRVERTLNEHLIRNQIPEISGKISEIKTEELIRRTFGKSGNNFEYDEKKKNHPGDYKFKWKGFQVIWKDKNYGENNIERNVECDVLIFVSENCPIMGHDNFDVNIVGSRLDLFIGSFGTMDKVGFIERFIMPIIISFVPFLKSQVESEPGQKQLLINRTIENIKKFIKRLNDLNDMIKTQKKALAKMEASVSEMEDDLIITIADLKQRRQREE